ncbi:MAG: phosphoenolpyruvate--protein phosphotransferase [Synergistaceae bacterium]|jgi:phosphocarrier protein FPr|nr:phosphoenolpyruvate--protein phosphotransferase [Synergistaceae bacterium]
MSEILNSGPDNSEWEVSKEITIISPHGFHARPAAILVKTAKKFASDIRLVKDDRRQNAKSLVAVMGFALQHGDTVALEAKGADAKEAIEALIPIIAGDMEDESGQSAAQPAGGAAARDTPPSPVNANTPRLPADKSVFRGITASPGIAAGVAKRVTDSDIPVAENSGLTPANEKQALFDARALAKQDLKEIADKTETASDASHAAIFGAHAELLEDPEMTEYAEKLILNGKSAAFAWKSSYETYAKRFAALNNELFAARAVDLRDVGRRVIRILTGTNEKTAYPENCILIAEELTPSDTASLDEKVLGFCTVKGGATSHIAILARSLGLPAIVGTDESILEIADGSPLILNADEGVLRLNPAPAEIDDLMKKRASMAERRANDVKNAAKPAVTRDGNRIEVAANIGGTRDANQAVSLGCDGVGLLRSEFLFLGRNTAPEEDELAEAYVGIARALGPDKPLVVRTMDIGGDKQIPYIKQDKEDNPFLGVRGLRLSLRALELFKTQIRAILRASKLCKLHIMFPMVSTLDEFREAAALTRGLGREMGVSEVKIGLMIEVPSAAILARHFAEEADFMSLGTNDLTQYTMAADRGNPKLAEIADGLNPAVLAMIKSTVDGARGKNCWVGVCGGIAGDPAAVPVLIGLGVDELSVSVPAIPQIKSRVRELSKGECEKIASSVLELSTAGEVRKYLKQTVS